MTIDIDGTWDIETESWDTFVCGAISDADGVYISWHEDAFARKLISKQGTYWAHNGGAFDHLWLVSWCARNGVAWSGVPRGASIVAMYVGDGLTLRDSRALWPDKLAVVSQLGGEQKIELALPCRCGDDCGGYCSIKRRGMPESERALLEEYLETDVVGLHAALMELVSWGEARGIEFRSTVGATAWATAKEWCSIEDVRRDVEEYRRIREAYYGGRTPCFMPSTSSGRSRDIGSAYPAALAALSLPAGQMQARDAGRAYAAGHAGVYTARVTIPECHVPPLPVREDERLVYPWGRVTGTWTGDELRHAQSRGVTVERIVDGMYWTERTPILKPYADRIWALREEAKRDCPAIYPWVKWAANSLTGKLAMKPEQETLYYAPDGEIPDNHHRIVGHVGNGIVYTIAREQVSGCAWVEHAAHLTAHTRVQVHVKLCEADIEAIYCDTDCVKSIRDLPNGAGNGLGEWSDEGSFKDWECLAPKLYRYTATSGKNAGKTIVKGKGMSGLTSEGFDTLKEGGVWLIDRGVEGAMRAIANGEPFARKSMARRHLGDGVTMGDRVIVLGGITQAPSRFMWP